MNINQRQVEVSYMLYNIYFIVSKGICMSIGQKVVTNVVVKWKISGLFNKNHNSDLEPRPFIFIFKSGYIKARIGMSCVKICYL